MAPYKKPQLSVIERLFIIIKISRALSVGFISLFTGLFRGRTGSAKLTNHAKMATIRALTTDMTTRDIQWLGPSLEERYLAYAKKHNFSPSSITLADGTKAFWLGDPSAEKVLVFFHGGGYNLPPDPLHISFTASLARSRPPSLSVLMLGYTLAPHATYPTQLREAVALIHHLLTVLHYPPSSVSLGGDSAGGNLTLAVLSHILHPHPSIPPLPSLNNEKLAGAILIAPWVSFAHHWPSITTNKYKDVVGRYQSDTWSQAFLGGAKSDPYNEPLALEEGDAWFEGLGGVVGDMLVTAGEDEVLCSSVTELVSRLRKWHKSVEFVVGKGEWHDMPLVAPMGGGGVQGEAVKEFVREKL